MGFDRIERSLKSWLNYEIKNIISLPLKEVE